MADQAEPKVKKSGPTLDSGNGTDPGTYGPTTRALVEASVVGKPTNSREQLTAVQIRAARLMAKGLPLPVIAKRLADYMVPDEPHRPTQLKKTRHRLRNWQKTQKFRDALFEEAMIQADVRAGEIMNGVIDRAVAGRIDAARLVFEMTGRHSPHTEIQPAQVNLVFGDIGRPGPARQIGDGEIVDADAEVEPEED